MANIIQYEVSTGKIINYLESVNTPTYNKDCIKVGGVLVDSISKAGILINPDISLIKSIPIYFWKVINLKPIEMSKEEKDAYILQNTGVDEIKTMKTDIDKIKEDINTIKKDLEGLKIPAKSIAK